MLAALYGKIKLVCIAHCLQRLEHSNSCFTAAAGADFVAEHFTGTAAKHENLSLFRLCYANELFSSCCKLLSYLHICFHGCFTSFLFIFQKRKNRLGCNAKTIISLPDP